MRSRIKRLFSYLGFVFLACGFGGFFLVARMFREDADRLPSDLDQAQKLGLPSSIEELRRKDGQVPDSQNGALLFAKAMKEFEKLPPNLNQHLWVRRDSPAAEQQEAAQALARFQPTMRILEKAAKYPFIRFSADPPFIQTPNASAPQTFNFEYAFGQMSLFIGNQCRMDLRLGNYPDALRNTETLLLLTERLAGSSTSIGWWSIVGGFRTAMGGLWRIMLARPNDSAVLDQLDRLIHSVELPDLYRMMAVDFAMGRDAISRIKSLEELGLDRNIPRPMSKTLDELYQTPGVKQAFEAKYVHWYVRLFQSLPGNHEDWPGIHDAIKMVNKEIARDPSADMAVTRALGVGNPINPLVMGMMQVEHHILIEAIAALQKHIKTGAYPLALPIEGPVSIDPFWGKPLHFQLTRGGFTIWSKGRNFGNDNPFGMKNGSTFRFRERREPVRMGNAY